MYNGSEAFLVVFCAMRPGKNIKVRHRQVEENQERTHG
jgi:hypothetical protein